MARKPKTPRQSPPEGRTADPDTAREDEAPADTGTPETEEGPYVVDCFAAERTRLVEALVACREAISNNQPDIEQREQIAREGILKLREVEAEAANLSCDSAPWPVRRALGRFVYEDLRDLDRIPAPPSYIRKLDEFIADFGGHVATVAKPLKPKGAVFNLATRVLTLNGKSLSLEIGEQHVLAHLVKNRTASLSDFKGIHERADRVLKGLRQKYPGLKRYISLPGGAGKGGYSTTIVAEEQP